MTSVNLNNKVSVVLTRTGVEAYYATAVAIRETVTIGSRLEFPLWEAMRIFGPYIRMGLAPPFENNEIHIEREP